MITRTKRLTTRFPCRLAFILALLAGLPVLSAASASGAGSAKGEAAKQVLILSSYNLTSPGVAMATQAMRATFRNSSVGRIQFYLESVDIDRFSEASYADDLVSYLRWKYKEEKIDLLIALGASAMQTLAAHRADFLPDTPIIFYYFDESDELARRLAPTITSVQSKPDYGKTLEIALALQPETERAVVVAGSSAHDKGLLAGAERELSKYADRVEITYLTDLTMEDLQQRLTALPPRSVVILLSVAADHAGKSFSGPEVVSLLASASSVPIYGIAGTYLGYGIVGGSLMDFEVAGARVAEAGMRIFGGARPQDIPSQTVPNVAMFDGRALRRWGISEKSLPPGSYVEFREPTFWGLYRWYITAGFGVALLEALLIAGLLAHRAHRRRAEEEARRLARLAVEQRQNLDDVISNVPGVVCESRCEPGGAGMKLQFVSSYAERLLGYSVEEWMAAPDFLCSIIHDEDREAFMRQYNAVLIGGGDSAFEFRWRAKDGRMLWAEARTTPILDESGAVVGMRGVILDITERKRVEERLRRYFELPLTGMAITLPDCRFIDINQKFCDMLGYSMDEMKEKSWVDLTHPDDVAENVRLLEQTLSGEIEGYTIDKRYIHRDGHIVHVSISARCVRRADRSVDHLVAAIQDITERKQTEAALRQSEQRTRDIVRTMPDLIFLMAPDGTYLDCLTKESSDLLLPPAEFIGKNMRDVMPAEVADAFAACFRRAQETGEPQVHEYMLSIQDEPRWFEVRIIHTSEDQLLSVVRNITERKRIETQLIESEQRFRHMSDTAPVMIWVSGPDKRCTYFNQRWLDFTGRTLEQELGNGWAAGIHPDDDERCLEIYHSAFDRREPFTMEYRLRRADGEYRWVFDSGVPRFSTNHKFLGYIGSCIDVTDSKRAEEVLQEAFVQVSEIKSQLEAENISLKEEIRLEYNHDEIIGNSEVIRSALYKVEQVAPTDTTVLILGETGTGKELIARALHRMSLRKNKPLVKVNCAALPATLIESELFGHERGAFTSATARRLGRFELADGGTIFLDEIGDLPLELQVKLLRVLQEGEFERLGSGKTIKVNVRIIAATNRNLPLEIEKGGFREDLWYRLNVFPIVLPPLRERREDIPALVEAFVQQFSKKHGKTIVAIAPGAMRTLTNYSWPGNVRELANVIERAMVNTEGTTLRLADQLIRPGGVELSSSRQTLEELERQYILRVLKQTGWRIEGPKGAARILGLNPSTLRTRMAKLKIHRSEHASG